MTYLPGNQFWFWYALY